MTKDKLEELRLKLKGLPKDDLEDRIAFYSEMIDDRMEEGLSEGEALKEIGTSDEVAAKVIEKTPLTKIIKEKVKPKRALKALEIILLVLGFPLWFPVLIVFLVFILVCMISLWSVVITLWAVEGGLIVGAFNGVISALGLLFEGEYLNALAHLGLGALSAGLAIFLFFGCWAANKYTFKLTQKITFKIKKLIVGKE